MKLKTALLLPFVWILPFIWCKSDPERIKALAMTLDANPALWTPVKCGDNVVDYYENWPNGSGSGVYVELSNGEEWFYTYSFNEGMASQQNSGWGDVGIGVLPDVFLEILQWIEEEGRALQVR
jgi:hypothetical protein